MNFAKKSTLVVLLLVAGGLAAAAQDRTMNFSLAHDVYFGSSLLHAGPYRMQVTSDVVPRVIVSSYGEKVFSAMSVVTIREYGRACKNTLITLKPAQDKMAMTSVCFADMDLTYYLPFNAKRQHGNQVAQTEAMADVR